MLISTILSLDNDEKAPPLYSLYLCQQKISAIYKLFTVRFVTFELAKMQEGANS